MKVEYVMACIMCGVHQMRAQKPTCKEEMEDWKLEAAPGLDLDKPHIWIESKIVHGWYGKSIPQMLSGTNGE